MDNGTLIGIIAVIVTLVIGVWQIYLQIQQNRKSEKPYRANVDSSQSVDANSISEINEIPEPKIDSMKTQVQIDNVVDEKTRREKPLPSEIEEEIDK